ncbi:MAG: NAD(P)H-dependent flavin oxidoreductase [Dehalococcoidia bacterium]
MKRTRVCNILGITYPILQAGLPWVSNPQLVAAVSENGGLGILHPTAAMELGENPVANLVENIQQVRQLTDAPFGVALYLPHPDLMQLIEAATEEGIGIAVTYGGSPALHTGDLKERDMIVLHQVANVRHARGAEAQGVDLLIAEGLEGGGLRGPDRVPSGLLIPQMVRAVSIPVVASGGIADARGLVAALALGAEGVQLGSRFVATKECSGHQRYKEAIMAAIDTGTVILGGQRWPTRVLRNGKALSLRERGDDESITDLKSWEAEYGMLQARSAMLDGDLDSGIAYCGAGAGLISEILSVREVFNNLVQGSDQLIEQLN